MSLGILVRSSCLHYRYRRPWSRALCLLAMMVAFALVSFVPAQEPAGLIDEVVIEGLTSYRSERILSRLETQPGGQYRPLSVRKDVEALSQFLRTVQVESEPATTGGLLIKYVVTEFPRFRHLQIIGNEKLKTERIEALISLSSSDVLDEKTQRAIARSIRNEYKTAGLPQAKVRLEIIDVPVDEATLRDTPEADVQIIVDEGRQVLCKNVTIQGNDEFASLRLKTQMDTRGSLGFIKNYYDDQSFEDDLVRLREFYAAHGYFDATVERGVFKESLHKGAPSISPVIRINEGQRYRFGKASVSGARLFSQAEVLAFFEPLEGGAFDGEAFHKALEGVQDLYLSHGLLTTRIVPDYRYDPANRVIDLDLAISESGRIHVGEVKIRRKTLPEGGEDLSRFGEFYTKVAPPVKDEVIASEILLEPGSIYNKKLERESMRRLARLGVFDARSLEISNEPTVDPRVHNVLVTAEESVSGALSGGVGFGDGVGAFLFAQIEERNIGGEADAFRLRTQLGTHASNGSITFVDRHWRDSDDSLTYQLFYQQLNRVGYDVKEGGGSIEWAHPLEAEGWTRYLCGRVGYAATDPDHDTHTVESLDRGYGIGTLQLRFEEDTRWPLGGKTREGYRQAVSVEAGYAGGALLKAEYWRDQYWRLSQLLDRPSLNDNLVYRLRFGGGMMPYPHDVVPIEERFFLGGNNDLRGFSSRGAGYHDRDDDDVAIGGAAKLLMKNEMLFPVYDPVSGALFLDVGALGESPVSWEMPRASTGAGLRLDFNRTEIALDLAVPLLSESDDDTRYFHFSLKSQF